MSIKVMTRVWEESTQDGAQLLLLLALADHAQDDGVCWPGVNTLAHKARCSDRQIQRLLRQLEKRGEIWTLDRGEQHLSNLYLVTSGFSKEELEKTLITRFELRPGDAKTTAQDIVKKRTNAQKEAKAKKQALAETRRETAQKRKEKERVTSMSPIGGRVTSVSQKGDTDVTRSVIEPSYILPASAGNMANANEKPTPNGEAKTSLEEDVDFLALLEEEEQVEQANLWRKPQTAREVEILNACGRTRYDTPEELEAIQEILYRVASGDLLEEYLKSRLWCAENHKWRLATLIKSTLSEKALAKWQKEQ